ncbi:traB domain-containing protein-like isoform X1 [Populus alba x Populus x berolinensis]|nr:traB domain-containing protein-like isoform X1 [Populus alba x Populus x berolinensis]
MKTRYVKRLTRSLLTQLNSPQSHRFFSSTTTTKSPLRRHQTTLNSTRPTYSPPKFLQITTFATKNESIFDAADELREDDNKHDVASERKELPHDFSRNVVVLTCESKAEGGKCVVYLVGTAHVSQASCREVEAVIRHVKPQVVFLELCASRVGLLTIRNLKVPTMKEMIEKWKKTQNAPQIFLSWFYATVGEKLGVVPGSEFQVAFEEARKCEAKVVLGDRPAQITFRRTQDKRLG